MNAFAKFVEYKIKDWGEKAFPALISLFYKKILRSLPCGNILNLDEYGLMESMAGRICQQKKLPKLEYYAPLMTGAVCGRAHKPCLAIRNASAIPIDC